MSKTIRGTLLAVALFLCAVALPTAQASAAGGVVSETVAQVTVPESDDTQTEDENNAFTYTAQAGDSLSVIVRDALRRFSADREEQMSNAARMYCETTIVQDMGARLLEIGETVTVARDNLEQCAEASANLTEAQVAGWNQYAAQANLDAERVEPTNTDAQASGDEQQDGDNQDEEASDNQDQDEQAADTNEDDTTEGEESGDNQESIAWYWWVLALSIVGVVFYLLRDKPQNGEAKPARRNRK